MKIEQGIAIPVLLLAMAACAPTLAEPDGSDERPAMSFLRVDGNRFVDDSGQTVVLRGVSFSDPDWLEPRGQWNREYFEAARSWNANVVRIPVHPGRWRDRGEEAFLALLDQGIQWAGELGMYVIIDWHSIGNLRTERFPRDVYNTTFAETLHFWRTIAERYAGNPVVGFYELFNEPVEGGEFGPLSWEEHRAMMEEIIGAIRAHDATTVPLVAGFDWGYDLTPVREDPIRYSGVAYVSHPYPQKREPPWEEKWERDWGFAADVYPLFATEFGFMSVDGPGAHVPVIGDETYGQAILDYLERKGISWTAWVFDPIWSPQLIENWDFEPTRQGRFFRDAMMRLNPEPTPKRPGFYVEGRHLFDRCGEEVVLRGINRMTVVKDRDGIPSFPEIARTGANTVRIMWMMWRPAAEVGSAVANAIRHGLIPILEMHDATGKWHLLEEVVDYWLQPDMLEIIRRHEEDLIVNIANEAGDHNVTDVQFKDGYRQAIRRMRAAGIRTPLMIDAAGWGRNEEQLLRVAPWLLEQDPERNLIFSWHPWDPGDQEQRITQAMEHSVELDVPFVIGEFSHTTVGCAGEVPYRHIVAEAQRLGIGWLAWSWGPGNADCATMDMTTDSTFETLHAWGLEVAVTDPHSIKNTSVRPHSLAHGQCRTAASES